MIGGGKMASAEKNPNPIMTAPNTAIDPTTTVFFIPVMFLILKRLKYKWVKVK